MAEVEIWNSQRAKHSGSVAYLPLPRQPGEAFAGFNKISANGLGSAIVTPLFDVQEPLESNLIGFQFHPFLIGHRACRMMLQLDRMTFDCQDLSQNAWRGWAKANGRFISQSFAITACCHGRSIFNTSSHGFVSAGCWPHPEFEDGVECETRRPNVR